jgi:hypothetical protein
MQFDIVATNPPFQDTTKRGKTQHKLWIDFTLKTFSQWLKPGGILLQVSPSSFLSPSSKILQLFKSKAVKFLHLDTKTYFPEVGSTFADYMVSNRPDAEKTKVVTQDNVFDCKIDGSVFYLPIDLSQNALSVHNKVMFDAKEHLNVKYDYVTCHNVNLLRGTGIVNKTESDEHIHPILHTNKQTWYSRIRQDWASQKKVMWSRSGYTKPFYDDGILGGTDMVYYVLVNDKESGENLTHNLNSMLMRYILKTAKWSGFGNEKVFRRLPNLPTDRRMSDDDVFDFFNITEQERVYVRQIVE